MSTPIPLLFGEEDHSLNMLFSVNKHLMIGLHVFSFGLILRKVSTDMDMNCQRERGSDGVGHKKRDQDATRDTMKKKGERIG